MEVKSESHTRRRQNCAADLSSDKDNSAKTEGVACICVLSMTNCCQGVFISSNREKRKEFSLIKVGPMKKRTETVADELCNGVAKLITC